MRTRVVAGMVALCVACGGKIDAIPPPPPPDAGAPLDAAVTFDAAKPIDVSVPEGPGWCSDHFPYATLCDDFDLATVPRPEWTLSGTGLAVVSSTFASPPHALHVTSSSSLSFDVATAPYGAKTELEFEVDADGASGAPLVLASIAAENGPTITLAALPGTSAGRCTLSGFAGPSTSTDFPLARAAAHALSMKISMNSDGTLNLICIVDGTDHGAYSLPGTQNLGKVTHSIGATGATSGPIDVSADDVVIDD